MHTANLARHLVALRKRRDRHAGLTRRPLPANWWDSLTAPGRLYVGASSVTSESEHVKYVDPQEPLYPFTWAELAREWLVEQYHKLGLIQPKRWRADFRNDGIPAPIHFEPGPTPGDWAYVDIRACYGHLLGRWPIDSRYMRRVALTAGRNLYRPGTHWLDTRELVGCKPLRLAVWGTVRGSKLQWRTAKGEWKTAIGASPLSQPGIAAMVLVLMHEIAWRAVRDFGARMILTDAAILPLTQVFPYIDFLKSLGLPARIEDAGPAELTGFAAYRVNQKQSELYGQVTAGAGNLLEPMAWATI